MMKCGMLYVEYEDEKTRMMNSVMYIVRWEYVLLHSLHLEEVLLRNKKALCTKNKLLLKICPLSVNEVVTKH